ncbi:hypothetical protein CR513_55174, partial [Mucuna pruriens]
MVTSESVLDTILKVTNIAASIGASLKADAMALTVTPLPGIRIPRVEPINTVTVPQTLPILTPIATTPGPALNPVAIVSSIHPIALIPSINEVMVHPTPVAPPLVKLPLVKIPIAVKLHPFPHYLRCLPPRPRRLSDEPLHRPRRRLREPQPPHILLPRMLRRGKRVLYEPLVLGREVERHSHENQRQQHVLRGGHLQVEEVEQKRARAEEKDRQSGISGRPVGLVSGSGSGLGLGTGLGFLALLVIVNIEESVFLFLFLFLLGDDGREAVNGRSDCRGRTTKQRGVSSDRPLRYRDILIAGDIYGNHSTVAEGKWLGVGGGGGGEGKNEGSVEWVPGFVYLWAFTTSDLDSTLAVRCSDCQPLLSRRSIASGPALDG